MRLFKVFFKAAALTVVLMAMAAAPARAVEFKTNAVRCSNDKTDPDLRIGACTWLLNFGRLAEKSISGAYDNRGNAYRRKGQTNRAIADYDQAIALNPHAAMHNGIAWKLATMPDPGARNGAEAVRLAERRSN